MSEPKLVAICGDIGSGKNTVADHLRGRHGYGLREFATKLKEVICDVYGIPRRYAFGTQAEKNHPLDGAQDRPRVVRPDGSFATFRYLAETIGTDGFRAGSPTTWVDYTFREIDGAWDAFEQRQREPQARLFPLEELPPRYVIPGIRFPNEFDAVRSRGGVIWKTVRAGAPAERTGHESDEAWRTLPVDGILYAVTGDLDGLRRQADVLLRQGGRGHSHLEPERPR